jgi:hypothetical protein
MNGRGHTRRRRGQSQSPMRRQRTHATNSCATTNRQSSTHSLPPPLRTTAGVSLPRYMTLQMHAHAHAVRSRLPLFYLPLPPVWAYPLVSTTRARSSVVHAATILPRPAASVFKAPVLLLRRRVHVSSASPFELLGLPCSATPASRSNRPTAARRCSCTQTCIQGMLQRWRTLGCCRTRAGERSAWRARVPVQALRAGRAFGR